MWILNDVYMYLLQSTDEKLDLSSVKCVNIANKCSSLCLNCMRLIVQRKTPQKMSYLNTLMTLGFEKMELLWIAGHLSLNHINQLVDSNSYFKFRNYRKQCRVYFIFTAESDSWAKHNNALEKEKMEFHSNILNNSYANSLYFRRMKLAASIVSTIVLMPLSYFIIELTDQIRRHSNLVCENCASIVLSW